MQNTGPLDVHRHAVKFYPNEQSLFTTVGGFIGQGLVDNQPAVLIVTRAHRDGILEELAARLIDIKSALRLGELMVLDAHETLDRFMVGDVPQPDAFEQHIGGLIGSLVDRHPEGVLVRAYGEMVDVLWQEGRCDAAIRLEILWNRLASRYGFALLCGYSMEKFHSEIELLEKVCEQHTHVMPPDPPTTDSNIH
jgi:hypothetical protein